MLDSDFLLSQFMAWIRKIQTTIQSKCRCQNNENLKKIIKSEEENKSSDTKYHGCALNKQHFNFISMSGILLGFTRKCLCAFYEEQVGNEGKR